MVSRNNKSNKSSFYLSESHTLWISFFFLFFPIPPPRPHLGILVYIYMLLQETGKKRTQQLLMHCLLPHLQLLTSNEILLKLLALVNTGPMVNNYITIVQYNHLRIAPVCKWFHLMCIWPSGLSESHTSPAAHTKLLSFSMLLQFTSTL